MADHLWTIDSIEEGIARVEEDGHRMLSVPVAALPKGVTEGQVLRVVRETKGAEVVVTSATVDEGATAQLRTASQQATAAISKESRKRDPGGNVVL